MADFKILPTVNGNEISETELNAAANQTVIDDATKFATVDGGVLKTSLWSLVKSTLLTYFSTLFAVLAGTAGGQSLSGGNAANDDLTLQGTTHATRDTSYVLLQPTAGNVGIGTTEPTQKLHVYNTISTILLVEANAATAFSGFIVQADDAAIQLDAQVFGGAFTGNQFGNARADTSSLFTNSGLFTFGTKAAFDLILGTTNLERMRIAAGGNVGIGTTTPQGRLHVHDGTGGWLFVSKTAIAGTPITVLPDGSGDILKGAFITGWLDNSVPQSRAFQGACANGGTLDDTSDGGTNTLRFAVSAAGALTVVRQAGAATWAFSAMIVWK